MKIRIPIDIKSLYLNIKNDNKTGHTATVATPMKQGASVRPELALLEKIPEEIDPQSKEDFISALTSKSRAEATINRVLVFDKIAVNGTQIDVPFSFCMYIREEIGASNIHYGRKKLHYPSSLKFDDVNTAIDNGAVLKAISEHLHDYAFIVEAFEYFEEEKLLNFDATIVGNNQIPYSKVFINRRGVGNKFTTVFANDSYNYDMEVIALREKMGYDKVFPDNYVLIAEENIIIAQKLVLSYLTEKGAFNIRILKDEYPYSLYDIEYIENGRKKYAIVQQTATDLRCFTIPIEKYQFINAFPNDVTVFLVTDIRENPVVLEYNSNSIGQLGKTITSIRFEDLE